MITESVVVDVSQDWVVACGLQERFMETPCAKTQRLSYNARCRQMRALGGDCFHFVPLPGRRVALAVADASGKGLPAAAVLSLGSKPPRRPSDSLPKASTRRRGFSYIRAIS
jgi:hypothetical protein